jgi:hypothetical protein
MDIEFEVVITISEIKRIMSLWMPRSKHYKAHHGSLYRAIYGEVETGQVSQPQLMSAVTANIPMTKERPKSSSVVATVSSTQIKAWL